MKKQPAHSRVSISSSRRQFVRGVGLGMCGLGLPELLAAQASAEAANGAEGSGKGRTGKAKSCIMIFLFGGPSHMDTWDMKPHAAAEYRGTFRPIATRTPGIEFCEHLPRTATLSQHVAVIQGVTNGGRGVGNGDHHADTYYVLTGNRPDRTFFTEGINRKPHDDDWPFIGSTVAARTPHAVDLPGVVQLPQRSGEITGYINPGQFSGMLGPNYEPLMVRGVLEKPRELTVPDITLPEGLDLARLDRRRAMLSRLDDWQRRLEQSGAAAVGSAASVGAAASSESLSNGPLSSFSQHHQRAFGLLTSQRLKQAFDLSREPEAVRARYGEDVNGQSVLMARRLVEAGVPFVCVHWIGRKVGAGLSWDTHSDNFGQLKDVLLPAFDACYSALLEDLARSGRLDETLVVVNAEMGRTPKVGDPRAGGGAGRDHWDHCMSVLLAGGGVRGGQVYGASDKIGAYPASRSIYPEDVAQTIYHSLGIADRLWIHDRQGRPLNLQADGDPLPVFG